MSLEIIGRITGVEHGPGSRKTLTIHSDAYDGSTAVLTKPNSSFNYGCSNKEYRDINHVFTIRVTRNGGHYELVGGEPRPATAEELIDHRDDVMARLVETMSRHGITPKDLESFRVKQNADGRYVK